MAANVPPNFLTAMQRIYGQFESINVSAASDWQPPPMSEGHKGRYLWTDSFGTVNFLTLYHLTRDERYLILAKQLIQTVHLILGFTQDGRSRLPGATAEWPLRGGLRIGKEDASGPDADGQYYHYLTMWMFALNRISVLAGDPWYNEQAISLAEAIHPRFVYSSLTRGGQPRMVWKMSMDLSEPLVRSEGNLDPIDGYVTFQLLREAAGRDVLGKEIEEYRTILDMKWRDYSSDDPLDLGMTLWTAHWFAGKEEWADGLIERAVRDLGSLNLVTQYFELPATHRLAFREFGTCLGIQSAFPGGFPSHSGPSDRRNPAGIPATILKTWQDFGLVPEPRSTIATRQKDSLLPITLVMYATALLPGAFIRGFIGH